MSSTNEILKDIVDTLSKIESRLDMIENSIYDRSIQCL